MIAALKVTRWPADRTFWHPLFEGMPYPMDTRLRSQVASLLDAGYRVTVIAPSGYGYDSLEEMVDGARVRRFRPAPGGRGTFGNLREYGVALCHIARLAWRTHRVDPVDVVFVSNPPDLLLLCALSLVWRGARVMYDARERSPELFEAKFRRRGGCTGC